MPGWVLQNPGGSPINFPSRTQPGGVGGSGGSQEEQYSGVGRGGGEEEEGWGTLEAVIQP